MTLGNKTNTQNQNPYPNAKLLADWIAFVKINVEMVIIHWNR